MLKSQLEALTCPGADLNLEQQLMPEPQFRKALALEEKLAERSHRRFVLMLLESSALLKEGTTQDTMCRAIRTLIAITRETDIKGWYKAECAIGVIFTELGDADGHAVANALMTKVTQALSTSLRIEEISKVAMSFYIFPEEPAAMSGTTGLHRADVPPERDPHLYAKGVKRALDIGGGLVMLLLSAPLMVAAAVAVKLTSPGPILFRQTRIGRRGVPFTFLKFRTMYEGSDVKIHQEFVTRFIRREIEPLGHYKLTSDARITRVGEFLRKTSLDELPQLLNVLLGNMSLVGPRPPIPYEFESYQLWHRRRIMNVKPGITGLWQVTGRSRVTFDDMVRLDLRYARRWSLWLDLRILLATPRAVLSGAGAY